MELTAAGRVTYTRVVRIFEELEQLSAELATVGHESLCRLCFCQILCDGVTGNYLLPPLISEFRKNFSDIVVTATTIIPTNSTAAQKASSEERWEIAILPIDVEIPSAIQEFTFPLPLTVVANPKLLDPATPVNWERLPFVLPPPDNSLMDRAISSFFRITGIGSRVIAYLNNPEVVRKVLLSEPAAAITHKIVVQKELDAGLLVELPSPVPLPAVTQVVASRESRRREHLTALIEFLRERLTVA